MESVEVQKSDKAEFVWVRMFTLVDIKLVPLPATED